MRLIPLNEGKAAMVDDGDYPELSKYKWHVLRMKDRRTIYAQRNQPRRGGKRLPPITMHRQLMPHLPRIDHRDGNGLNNQRQNLRPATETQNLANSRKRNGSRSQFKGVSYDQHRNLWRARLQSQGRTQWLGRFSTALGAAKAYDTAALATWGEYAATNQSLGLFGDQS